MGEQRIDEIDGWRAVAVTLVIIAHIDFGIAGQPYYSLLYRGALGVQIFFVISGFVITLGFLNERERHGTIDVRGFYIRRAFRILPPLLLYLGGVTALAVSGLIPTDAYVFGLWKSLIFVCNFQNCGGTLGAHLWSLSAEEQFYLAYPVLILVAGLSIRSAFAAFIAMPVICLALYATRMPHIQAVADVLTSSCWLLAGCFAAHLHTRNWTIPRSVVPVAFIALYFAWFLHYGAWQHMLYIFATPTLTALMLLGTLHGGGIARALSFRPIVELGRFSYGLYLWQQLATYPGSSLVYYLGTVSIAALLAFALFYLVERRLINYGRRLAGRRHVPVHSVTPATATRLGY